MKVGFIGLGTMGRPIAQHLMRKGHSATVFARRPEVLVPLVAEGASTSPTPAGVAEASEVVFTMVTATHDVEQVLFGPHGILEGAHSGLLVVDMTTIAPRAAMNFAPTLAAAGVDLLDAPVSGGPEGARNGTLSVMVGGTPEAFARAKPLLECFGKTILHMGASGAGQATKACHQLLLLITAEGVAEALLLAQRSGVDPALARQAMLAGIASSRVLDRFGERMATRNFDNGISLRLYKKDLQIALDFARSAGAALPAGELTMAHIQRLVDKGLADADLSALITALENAVGAS
jgi:2-hydroxy-3-oxopropionate reductase